MKPEIGNTYCEKDAKKLDVKTMVEATPKAAPEDTPIKPGSANGFLKRPCKHAPETDKLAPTKPASSTLGNLISYNTELCNGFNLLFIKSLKEILKLPVIADIIKITKSKTIKNLNRNNCFLDI